MFAPPTLRVEENKAKMATHLTAWWYWRFQKASRAQDTSRTPLVFGCKLALSKCRSLAFPLCLTSLWLDTAALQALAKLSSIGVSDHFFKNQVEFKARAAVNGPNWCIDAFTIAI